MRFVKSGAQGKSKMFHSMLSALVVPLVVSISVAAQEKVIFKLDNSLGVYPDTHTLKIKIIPTGNGILISTGPKISKLSKSYAQIWSVDLKKDFLQRSAYIVADEYATVIMEIKSGKKIEIVHITDDGVVKEHVVKIDESILNSYFDIGIRNGKLLILLKKRTQKNIRYRLFEIDGSGVVKAQNISLPATDEENNLSGEQQTLWGFWEFTGNEITLLKSYCATDQHTQAKILKTSLLELNNDGSVSGERSLKFPEKLMGHDRVLDAPIFKFNKADGRINVIGTMAIADKKVNALYMLQYDYQTGQLIEYHDHLFSDLFKPEIKLPYEVLYSIPESITKSYPRKLSPSDVFIDEKNNLIDIRVINNLTPGKVTFFEVRFDQHGKHIQTAFAGYEELREFLVDAIPPPIFYEPVWKNTLPEYSDPNFRYPWDEINKHAVGEKSDEVFFLVMSSQERNEVFKVNAKDRTITVSTY